MLRKLIAIVVKPIAKMNCHSCSNACASEKCEESPQISNVAQTRCAGVPKVDQP